MALKVTHKDVGDDLSKTEWVAEDSHVISGAYTDLDAVAAAKADADIADAITKKHSDALSTHQRLVWSNLRVGEYILPFSYRALTTFSASANMIYGFPICIARDMTFDRIAIHVSTAVADKKARLGIYDVNSLLEPTTLVLDAGEVSVAATGVQAIVINQKLTKATYVVVVNSEGAPGFRAFQGTGYLGMSSTSFAADLNGWYDDKVYGALATPFPAVTGSDMITTCPLILLRLASLD